MVDVRVELEPGSLRKLVQASRTWDKTSRAEMRKRLRSAAGQGADAAKSSVLGPPPGGGGSSSGGGRMVRSRGLRSGLAAGVKVSIRSGREASSGTVSGEGVRVTTTSASLPSQQAPMVKAYMAGQFRHPVFGGPGWASQRGKNWFYGPLRSGRAEYQAAVVKAVEEASQAIARG